MRYSYRHTIVATPVQAVLTRDMVFNLVSVFDWRFIITKKQQKVDIDHVQKSIGKSVPTTQLSILYMWRLMASNTYYIIRDLVHI